MGEDDREREPGERLDDVTCPRCRRPFPLRWNSDTDLDTVVIRLCPGGGVRAVRIACPHCDYVEEL